MKTTTTTLLLVCFSLLVASGMASSPSEINALMDFYNSTNGPYWTNKANWGKGDPCYYNWYGVSCSQDNNQVTGLSLSYNRLAGTIPESFGQLSNLNNIYLPGSKLYGTLPQSFSNLTSLSTLTLSSNSFTGPFPDVLFSFKEIITLDITGNTFSGQLPDKFNEFNSIQTLNIGSNVFSGSIPPTMLNNLSNCRVSVSYNQLTSIPWDQWTNQLAVSNSSFDISNTQLSGSLSYQIYWPKSINFGNNLFTGSLPELNTTNGTPTIKGFTASGNLLTGNLPVSLTQATYLTTVYVDYNYGMSGQIPVQYASMPYLQSLSFYRTGLTCPKNNYQWDNFVDRAYTSCASENHDDYSLIWIITLYICGIIFLLALAALIIFCSVRKPNKIVIIE